MSGDGAGYDVENSKRGGIGASLYRQAIGARAANSQVFVNYQLTTSEINSGNVWAEVDCIAWRGIKKDGSPQGTWPAVISISDRDCRSWRIGRTQQQRTDHAG